MTRRQRLRVCGNLMQLVVFAKTPVTRRVYKQQLERTAARLKGGESAS